MNKQKYTPQISIVTVVFNEESEIERTIKSVTNQTYQNIQYIVIDGNSNDKTLNILNQYKNKIDILVSEPDDGIYDAMNKAINLASGKWINFMNAGDTFANIDVISSVINRADDKVDIFYGSRNIYTNKKTVFDEARNIDEIFYKMPFGHQASFVKLSLMKKYKYDLSYKLSSDYDFFLKCYVKKYKFKNMNFPVCNFYAGGLSYKHKLKSTLETLKILSDYTTEENVKKSVYYKNFIKRICSEHNNPKSKTISLYARTLKKIKGIK